jgi:hypothetical protein
MWVNASKDGGKTWSLPVDIVTDPLPALNSLCDTIPGGIAVDPNTGWVYVAWAAGAGPLTNAGTGCNYTQGTVFSNIYVAVSKDEGATWKTTLAFAGPDYTQPEPGDTSELFSTIAVDRAGAVHVAFTDFLDGEFGVYYATSPKADSAGALSFSTAKKVSTPDAHTAYFPRLVAGDSGRVDLIYLGTSVKNVTATAANKAAFNTDTPGQPNCSPEADTDLQGIRFPGKPCQLPGEAQWFLYMAQTLDGGGSWTNQKLRPDPMHMGDICTLGIFCLFGDDRDLADVNDVRIDATGGAQVAYTYEPAKKDHTEVDFQCQTGGPGLLAGVEVRSCLEPASLSNPPTTLLGGHGGGGTGTMPATGGDRRLAVAGSALLLLALALRALRPRAQPF